jgi:hypothetical protein
MGFALLAFLVIVKTLYEATQDLIRNTWNKLDNNKVSRSLKVYCHLP